MSDPILESNLATALLSARERCVRQGFFGLEHAGVSARLPGGSEFLFVDATAAIPQRQSWLEPLATLPLTLHAAAYRFRPDVGAVLTGGGVFAAALHDFGGAMPVGFDEQARHLGRMPCAVSTVTAPELQVRLGDGTNTILVGHLPVCLGTTCQRLVLNAELLEKCAKAYVLASATGQHVGTLPWWVCRIAMGRLRKDQRRAARRFALGLLPEETRGY
jgi:ribulose-5-phosphate 4-epimerase/fuculose-1-phosphate aldolase